MKGPEYHVPENPAYKYPTAESHRVGLATFVQNAIGTLTSMHGEPLMDGKPVSWGTVVTRHLYPSIPPHLFGTGVAIVAYVPYEVLTHLLDYAQGKFPPWMTLGAPVNGKNEGVDYLRYLTADDRLGPDPNQN